MKIKTTYNFAACESNLEPVKKSNLSQSLLELACDRIESAKGIINFYFLHF